MDIPNRTRKENQKSPNFRRKLLPTAFLAMGAIGILFGAKASSAGQGSALGDYVVLGYNDLGMHCMNQDFSEICILPPFNTLRATVIDRRNEDPKIATTGITLEYSIPGNTNSINKTNFWDHSLALFGVQLPPNVGLTGNGLTGSMALTADKDWMVTGIPITPVTDTGVLDPYQFAQIVVKRNGVVKDVTQAVVPVSWEIHCDYCHVPKNGDSVAMDILKKHDRMHGTNLRNNRPVLCAACHADPALGTPGMPGVSSMSSAMHTSHAKRTVKPGVNAANAKTKDNTCYNCHPGVETQCFRDVHYARGMTCQSCHGDMKKVGDPSRTPWAQEPRCGSCHNVPGHEYEQPGKLFRDSVGHKGVKCVVCHNSPHVIYPAVTDRDNQQMNRVQGRSGTLNTCSVCHTKQPEHPFFHKRES